MGKHRAIQVCAECGQPWPCAGQPSERRAQAAIAAHESWGRTTDRSARTAPARAAMDQKFLDAAEGDPVRAAHLKKAHFARLALKSAQARRAKKQGG